LSSHAADTVTERQTFTELELGQPSWTSGLSAWATWVFPSRAGVVVGGVIAR
jgi:hypothetical protein